MIAATALANRLPVYTCNPNDFAGFEGLANAGVLPLWLVGPGINMYIGVKRAGYSASAEAPIFLIVFGVPAAVALFAWAKLR
jgi:hypothetical protein